MRQSRQTLRRPAVAGAKHVAERVRLDVPRPAGARHLCLIRHLGPPHLLPTGLWGGSKAKVFAAQSALSKHHRAACLDWACTALSCTAAHKDELAHKQHSQLQLTDLLHTAAGNKLITQFRNVALEPFIASGMHVAAFEVVFSQHNVRPKASYKGFHISNKLGCHHQDLRMGEPWFDTANYNELPGSLRLVYDISPAGQRWFEFKLLRCGQHGLWLDEQPLLEVSQDLVAFDRLAAGSGGFSNPGGSWIFHARRSSRPEELGVSVVVDLVVTAGLPGTSTATYDHTPAFMHFHT